MCTHKDLACQQRGENEQWEENLPKEVMTHKGMGLQLRALCPGCVACEGNLDTITILPTQLDFDGRRLRYFCGIADIRAAEKRLLKRTMVVIGAFFRDLIIGEIHIGRPDEKGVVEIGFITNDKFTRNGIALQLLETAYVSLPKVMEASTLKITTLQENNKMRVVMKRFAERHNLSLPYYDKEEEVMVLEIPIRLAA